MTNILLTSSLIILACIVAHQISAKAGMPVLLLFMVLGMLCGSDGILKIEFHDYELTEKICSVALIFIMFYGGFCTNWKAARPVAVKAGVLSTCGVVLTAVLVCLFCHYVIKLSMIESFLIGAVISSTDAASVFSILRSKNLSLKLGTDSMLEVESGSNDPIAYMLTMTALTIISGENVSIPYMIFAQIVYGAALGIILGFAGVYVLQRLNTYMKDDLDTLFVIALMLISYSLPAVIGGNGYLSVYLTGIILGNKKIQNKIQLVHFFDGITNLAQILIFFLLGLLSFPHKIPGIFLTAVLLFLFLTLIARPLAIFLLLLPAKCSIRQCLLVSWAGLRGAASIVFAIMALASGVMLEGDIYHIIFLIALLSVAIQGTLLPAVSRKLQMVDESEDVRKTFTDYQEESAITLMKLFIPKGHNWENKTISEVSIPTGSLALMIKRKKETVIPKGDTKIIANDNVILSVPAYDATEDVKLEEIIIGKNHKWRDKKVADLSLPNGRLVALLKRGNENIIPQGQTQVEYKDIVVIYK